MAQQVYGPGAVRPSKRNLHVLGIGMVAAVFVGVAAAFTFIGSLE